jgi:hypothetical protein
VRYADRGILSSPAIDKVVVDVTGERCVDYEAQVRTRFLED